MSNTKQPQRKVVVEGIGHDAVVSEMVSTSNNHLNTVGNMSVASQYDPKQDTNKKRQQVIYHLPKGRVESEAGFLFETRRYCFWTEDCTQMTLAEVHPRP